nr:zinc finger, CCHC-type [Tanacetum cinerariifolium]
MKEMDRYRCTLRPETVEALYCAKDWLRSEIFMNMDSVVDEVATFAGLFLRLFFSRLVVRFVVTVVELVVVHFVDIVMGFVDVVEIDVEVVVVLEDKLDYLEHPIPLDHVPTQAGQQVAPKALAAHAAWELKTLFAQQSEHELLQSVRDFHSCKQEEGQFVSSYVLKIKSYIDNLERLGHLVSLNLRVSLILISLRKEFDIFVQNYNMHGMGKTINELHTMLKLHEQNLTKKDPALHAIQARKVQKKNNKQKKLQGSRKLKPGALSLYVGNGQCATVKAIEYFHLCLPSRLVIVLNNCHYAPSITSEIISVSYLYDDGYVNRFMDNAILVSRNNMVYFSVVLRDGSTKSTQKKTIKSLRFDRGREYMSREYVDHLKEHGIIAHHTPPYTPQHNGVSKRRNRTLLDMVHSMMSQTNLPKSFWDYALETATCILNMVLTMKVEKTPYESAYIEKILKRFHMENSKRGSIPMQEKLKLSNSQGTSTHAELKRMQNVPYASTVEFIIGDIKRELRVSYYTDAGYLTEAEYIAAYDTSKEAVWVKKFISGLGVIPTIEEPIKIHCGNTKAITIANESGITKGARHFHAKVHYLRDVIEYGDVKLKKDPQTAVEAWDHITTIFHDNKRTCMIALKAELWSLKLRDLIIDAYFHKIESMATKLTSLGSLISNDDVVTFALEGLNDKYENVASIIIHREPFHDIKIVSSMLMMWWVATQEFYNPPSYVPNRYSVAYPIPPALVAPAGQLVAPEILAAHNAWIKGSKEIAGLMLMTMEPEIQRNLEPLHAHEMLRELKTLFAQQAEQELLQTTRDFHSCRQEESQSVSSYVLKMKGYIDNLERLGHPNYNMHSMWKTVNESHAMLKLHEQTLPKNNAPALHAIRVVKVQKGRWNRNCPQYLAELLKKKKNAASGAGGSGIFVIELNTILNRLWIYDTGCGTHICNTTHGLSASRKLKPGALSLYAGNGQREAVEAIDAFHLSLPSGLEIVLNNCHYASSITRGVISISRLYEDDFINRFMNNTIHVSRNNMVYFSVIPRMVFLKLICLILIQMKVLYMLSTRTRHAPDRMCLYIDAEEHELGDLGEPANYKVALLDLESERWLNAMNVEIKWLFKKKIDMDGVVHTYKAHLVAKGYTQTPGIDYEETFSPVADIRVIRILIAIVAYYDYEMANGSILHGEFKRESIPMQEKLKLSKSQGASTPAELKCMQHVPYASAVGSIIVSCYTDAGYLTDADDLKSQVFILNGGAVDWKSVKQSIFATSSAEAEYIVAFDVSKEAVWVRKFISGLGVVPTIEEPISMYCDNTRAIAIANESGITKGARHFHAKVHYLREVIEYCDIKLEKFTHMTTFLLTPSALMVKDVGSKQNFLVVYLPALMPKPSTRWKIIKLEIPGTDLHQFDVYNDGYFAHLPLTYVDGVILEIAVPRMPFEQLVGFLEEKCGDYFQEMNLLKYLSQAITYDMDDLVSKKIGPPKKRYCSDFSFDEMVDWAEMEVETEGVKANTSTTEGVKANNSITEGVEARTSTTKGVEARNSTTEGVEARTSTLEGVEARNKTKDNGKEKSNDDSDYQSDKSVNYLSPGEYELIKLRNMMKANRKAKAKAKDKPYSEINKPNEENSMLADNVRGETFEEHDIYMNELLKSLKTADKDGITEDPFIYV